MERADGVVPDEPPIVREVIVEGLSTHDPVRIAGYLGYTVGQPVPSLVQQQAGVDQVWRDYGILLPNDSVQIVELADGIRAVLSVIEPVIDLEPRFVGNVTFDQTRLREWALLDERAELYVHEAPNVVDRLTKAYRRQGFHFVEVEAIVGGEGARRDRVIFEIREGPRVRVTKVHVNGNEELPDTGFWFWSGGLRSLSKLKTSGRGLFAWLGHKFDAEVLDADLIAMREVYRQRGYLDVRVELDRIEFRDDRRRAEVYIIVDEGPLYRVESIDLVGVAVTYDADGIPTFTEVPLVLPKEELLEGLQLRPGLPLEQARINEDQRLLRSRYGDKGHLEADFFELPQDRGGAELNDAAGWRFHEPEYTHHVEKKTVAVRYRVQPGRPLVVRSVQLEGNSFTRDRVIRREVNQMPGVLANFDLIVRSLRRIRGLGFFSDQRDPRHPDPDVAFVPVEGSPDEVDVVYRVRDGQTVDANLSGGVASDQGLIGLVSLSMRNFDAQNAPSTPWRVFSEIYDKTAFTGDGERVSIDLAPGSEVSYWRFLYSHPDIFGTHFDRYSTTFEFLNRERRFRSHDEERTRGRLTLGRNFGIGNLRASAGIQWQELESRNLDDDRVLPRTLLLSEGRATYFGLTGSISYDDVDNRIAPRDGWSTNWSNTLYLEEVGGNQDLWLSELSWDGYWHQSDDELTAASGFHLGLAGGVAVNFDSDRQPVNYGERFYLGGSQRMRGFRFRGVGPYEGDFAIGGETYLFGTAEYRIPLYATAQPGTSRRNEVLRGGLFVDWGILDPEAWEIDLKELRATAGAFIGLTQPFPITFNFGWPIAVEPGDERQVFTFRLAF